VVGRGDTRVAIGVCACLAGRPARYDGRVLEERVDLGPDAFEVVEVCPELAAGMPVPRPAVHLEGSAAEVLAGTARAVDTEGRDVAAELVAGARACVARLREAGVSAVVLKDRSPSCGLLETSQGEGSPLGPGVFGELVRREGWLAIPSGDLEDADKREDWLLRLRGRGEDARGADDDEGSG
jgi:uncharacterized protein YbbK (DUF523 family)